MLVGLTGGMGSGKSLVAELLAAHGATIIDADVLSREVVAPGTPGLAAVAKRFGDDVLRLDGSLDRSALGRIIFGDPVSRHDLEAIIHPAVRRRAASLTAAAGEGAVVVQVIPLLVETGQQDDFDHVVVVDVEPEAQLSRIRLRDGLSEPDARARLRAQAGREERLRAADVVLQNNGTPEDLAAAVDRLWDEWENRRA